ncbi:MAG: transcription elongation factor Spt5 [Candidatus Heimdallarchaeota archaeon]|nr:transcription elongation factor Spt5 [Candidatus Heimdallarchaeota archaeon]
MLKVNSLLDRVGVYCYKVKKGQEFNAAEIIEKRAELFNYNIKAVLVTEILGYLFIEGDIQDIIKAVENAHYIGKQLGRVPVSELEGQLIPTPVIEGLKKGDIVEIVDGPFKGSQAKISSIYQAREEITVDLLTSSVTIPIVLHADSVKLIEASEEEESEESDYL